MTEEGGNTEERRRLIIPDRRKHTYEQLQAHLDECIDGIEAYIHRWIRRGLIAFSIIALGCILGLVGFGIVLREVQNQRHEVCVSQNKRHDATVAAFKKETADFVKKHPEQKKDVEEGTAANLRIINALAPQQDCDKVAPVRSPWP